MGWRWAAAPVGREALRERISAAPESAYWAAGFGGNFIYVDEEDDLLIVLRWITELERLVKCVLEALEGSGAGSTN
jgi:hypothetical protein